MEPSWPLRGHSLGLTPEAHTWSHPGRLSWVGATAVGVPQAHFPGNVMGQTVRPAFAPSDPGYALTWGGGTPSPPS